MESLLPRRLDRAFSIPAAPNTIAEVIVMRANSESVCFQTAVAFLFLEEDIVNQLHSTQSARAV